MNLVLIRRTVIAVKMVIIGTTQGNSVGITVKLVPLQSLLLQLLEESLPFYLHFSAAHIEATEGVFYLCGLNRTICIRSLLKLW